MTCKPCRVRFNGSRYHVAADGTVRPITMEAHLAASGEFSYGPAMDAAAAKVVRGAGQDPVWLGVKETTMATTTMDRPLVDAIRARDRVTIVDRFGVERTGRAVMRGPYGWVLNMGGRYGTPAIATTENVTRVRKATR